MFYERLERRQLSLRDRFRRYRNASSYPFLRRPEIGPLSLCTAVCRSQVRLPKADPLAVTTVKKIERYVQVRGTRLRRTMRGPAAVVVDCTPAILALRIEVLAINGVLPPCLTCLSWRRFRCQLHAPFVSPVGCCPFCSFCLVGIFGRPSTAKQNKINTILLREGALLRREYKVDLRSRRLKEIQAAIARKKEARVFVIQEKQRVSKPADASTEMAKATGNAVVMWS